MCSTTAHNIVDIFKVDSMFQTAPLAIQEDMRHGKTQVTGTSLLTKFWVNILLESSIFMGSDMSTKLPNNLLKLVWYLTSLHQWPCSILQTKSKTRTVILQYSQHLKWFVQKTSVQSDRAVNSSSFKVQRGKSVISGKWKNPIQQQCRLYKLQSKQHLPVYMLNILYTRYKTQIFH